MWRQIRKGKSGDLSNSQSPLGFCTHDCRQKARRLTQRKEVMKLTKEEKELRKQLINLFNTDK